MRNDRAEGSSAIGDEGQAAIVLSPDADGFGTQERSPPPHS